MADLIREAPLGQILRYLSKNRLFPYPEELPDFEIPAQYNTVLNEKGPSARGLTTTTSRVSKASKSEEVSKKEAEAESNIDTTQSSDSIDADPYTSDLELQRSLSRSDTRPYTQERLDVDIQEAMERTLSRPIFPAKTDDGIVLVDWYTTDDPANPQNWSNTKKVWVCFVICIYTFIVYTGSAIYTSSIPGVISEFRVTEVDASLPLSLYVLAYGIGPMIFSPLSEIPAIGRSPVYFLTMLIFTIVSLPLPLVNNFAGLLVLRFLQGFFGSPCLATGGATMGDMISMLYLPYAMTAWVVGATCGPSLGPLISGFAVQAMGWRWSLWEIFWGAVPVLLVMFTLLPETSASNILLRRAARLRKLTGEPHLMAASEIAQRKLKTKDVVWDALIKPMEITIKDPAIAFVNIYTAIVYGIYYSFFEVFPLVYPVYYGFSAAMIGVVFLCILVSCVIGVAIYISYLYFYLVPDTLSHGLRAQEHRLVPALFAAFGPTIGLFIFAWTARPDIHWIAPTIGITIYGASAFIILQCIFSYVPMSYPNYAASLFAGNDFLRSVVACASILFAHPLFGNLGVARGTSLLGGLSVIGIVGIFALWIVGAGLRARSKFAVA
jgi:DHA1 family multidrug resistance protein-like MFS transporter